MRRLLECSVFVAMVLAAPAAASQPTTAEAKFEALYTREWAWRRAEIGIEEEDESQRPARDHLPDVSPAAQAKRLAYLEAVQRELAAIDPAALSESGQIDYAVYKGQIEALVDNARFRDYEKPIGSVGGFWSSPAADAGRTFRTEADYVAYIAMMRDVPRYFDQQIANLRAGLARGFTAPREILVGRDAPVAAIADAKSPDDTPYFKPFKTMPATIPAVRQEALKAEARTAISQAVVPSYAKLLTFLRTTYFPEARKTVGASDLPNGRAYYLANIRSQTTLDEAPEAIHALGLREIARIQGEMRATMREAGFTGDLPAFFAYLRTEKRFYPTTAEQLMREAAWISKRFDAVAPKYFGLLPRQRFAIIPMPEAIAPFSTYALGGPGYFLLNTYNLPSRPLYVLTALTLHESAPGHAFQMPLAAENGDLPEFRRKSYISAFGEGWALYCEKLGVEMGMYETPYDKFGMLNYQAWRAARLVVDTGIHAKGWSRARAIAYMHDNTSLNDHEIETEVDRYISGPGQALSYYLGEMAIVDARAKAEKALGDTFDIRAFHDTVLSLGSVPLPLLTARIDRFIAEGGKGPWDTAP